MRRYLPGLPAFLLLLWGTLPGLIRFLDLLGRAEVLVSFYRASPTILQVLTHPIANLVSIGLGFAWLAYLQQQRRVETTILTAQGKPYLKPTYPITITAVLAIILAAIISGPIWFYSYFAGSPPVETKHTIEKERPPSPPVTTLLLATVQA
jgi:hypothetical protein